MGRIIIAKPWPLDDRYPVASQSTVLQKSQASSHRGSNSGPGSPLASLCTDNAIPTSDHHIDYVFCQTLVTLRVNRTLTFSFSAVGYLLMLYLTLVTTLVEYVSFVRNSVSTADAKQLERIQ